MSIHEVNQRWLATMGLDDASLALLANIRERVEKLRASYGARPPWWRPFRAAALEPLDGRRGGAHASGACHRRSEHRHAGADGA